MMDQIKNKPKVLLVDDDITAIMLLRASVTQWGFPVLEANDGDEALKILSSDEKPGIILLDWLMPKIDGITICEKLNTSHEPRPYIILLTHNRGKANLVKAIESGADEFIEKPVNIEELRCRIIVATRVLSGRYYNMKNFINGNDTKKPFED